MTEAYLYVLLVRQLFAEASRRCCNPQVLQFRGVQTVGQILNVPTYFRKTLTDLSVLCWLWNWKN